MPVQSTSSVPPPPALWRRILWHPLFWALACFLVALPWVFTGNSQLFVPFFLALLGGWLCGHAIVRFTFNLTNSRVGLLVHVLAALIFGVLLWLLVSLGSDWLQQLPRPVRHIVFLLEIAAAPGVAWLLISLLSRVMDIPLRRATKSALTRTIPEWEERGKGTQLRFRALRMQLRTLGWIIATTVAALGVLVVFFLISFDWLMRFGSPQLIMIVVGLVFALPAYAVLKYVLGRRTLPCSVLFGEDHLQVETGNQRTILKYVDIQELTWRTTSDYARLVIKPVRAGGQQLSLIPGMAKVGKNIRPELPPLSQRTQHRLKAAGLEPRPDKRPGLTTFHRPPIRLAT